MPRPVSASLSQYLLIQVTKSRYVQMHLAKKVTFISNKQLFYQERVFHSSQETLCFTDKITTLSTVLKNATSHLLGRLMAQHSNLVLENWVRHVRALLNLHNLPDILKVLSLHGPHAKLLSDLRCET